MVAPLTPRIVKRTVCHDCQRPMRGCICSLIASIDNQVELLVIQDKTEAGNAKNTGSLLHRSLQRSALFALDSDQPAYVNALNSSLFSDEKFPILLYPPTVDAIALGLDQPDEFHLEVSRQLHKLRLVVIDATWRKSRKILYLNRSLQKLPRLTLQNPPKSLYTIRKSDKQNQLSTLEASCYALQQLEQNSVDYSPLLSAMRKFVSLQAGFVPERVN